MAHDVFISYSSADKPIGDAACATLEARGIRCWIAPRDILPGDEWGSAIVHAIQGSRAFVLVFSSRADKSHQVVREVERAVNRGIPVIPFRIENVMPTESLEYFINTPHWLDAFHPPMEQHLNYLADVIKHILEGSKATLPKRTPAPPPSAPPASSWQSLVTPRNLIATAGGLALFAVAIWFAATRFSTPAPTQPTMASAQPAADATLITHPAVAKPASPEPQGSATSTTDNRSYADVRRSIGKTLTEVYATRPGGTAELLASLGMPDVVHAPISMSDVDGVYQTLGCDGLIDTRNLVYSSSGLPLPEAHSLQVEGKGYAIDTSALNPTARVNVEEIQDYGKRAQCG
jgi:hypothetical protein